MATVRIPDENRSLRETEEIRALLKGMGITYERWPVEGGVSDDPSVSAEAILEAYAGQIHQLKVEGGYHTADVIDVHPETPGLEAMLAKFNIEHWHDEDEVRFVLAGRGLFHIHAADYPVIAIEVEAGDLIRVPRGTRHWFDLCGEKRIRAIRLFQYVNGWTPHYTHSAVDRRYEPVCFGPRYIPPQPPAK
jgi:1,2-dihydroxy-3-keto-5-methylthiopentene dioxygenase